MVPPEPDHGITTALYWWDNATNGPAGVVVRNRRTVGTQTHGWSIMRFIKKIVERGNMTIPSDVRAALEIDEDDIVEFEIVTIVKNAEEKRMLRNQDDRPTDSNAHTPTMPHAPRRVLQ